MILKFLQSKVLNVSPPPKGPVSDRSFFIGCGENRGRDFGSGGSFGDFRGLSGGESQSNQLVNFS